MAEGEKDNTALYVLLGCAGLLVLGLCAATGVGVWMVMEQASSAPPVAYPMPPGPVPGPTVPTPPPPVAPSPFPPTPGPALPPPPSFAPPMLVRATIDSIEGASPVAVGTACEFTVERQPSPEQPSGYWCRTQIVCGGRLLYGGPSAGFFPCTLGEGTPRTVVGQDVETTSVDTDASMTIDTSTATLTIRDDSAGPFGAYGVRARITETR
jgi:hypothetical protein